MRLAVHHRVVQYARVALLHVEIHVKLIVVRNVWVRVATLAEIARIPVKIDVKMHALHAWVHAMENVVITVEPHVEKIVLVHAIVV